MAGSLSISGTQTGQSEQGSRAIGTFTITMGTVAQQTETTLASGANTITVPTAAVGCVIVPPSSNAVALTLKGVTGDTGITISPTNPTLLAFPSTPPATFVVTAASATSGTTAIVFF